MRSVLIGVVLAAGVAVGVSGCGSAGAAGSAAAGGAAGAGGTTASCGSGAATLTAVGTATATEPPDVLTLVVGVSTGAVTAAGALQDNNIRSLQVIDVLRLGGVAAGDVQSSGLSVQPNYSAAATPVITGYQVVDTVTAQLRRRPGTSSWAAAGELVDRVVAVAGDAVRIEQLSFGLSQPGALTSRASDQAAAQAAAQARQLATAAGVRLGRLCSLQATAAPVESFGAGQAAASSDVAVPLTPGVQQQSAEVSAVYSQS